MAPKLYSSPFSSPVRAVLMCAKAVGVELEVVPVNLLEREHLTNDFLKKNPQHTIPVLEDDGFIVSDSHAIMAYLVAKYGIDDTLYPQDDFKQRATIDHRLHFDTGILFFRGALITKNPQHTIPVLEDDGFIVSDSHAIMAYLVAKYGIDDTLYPQDDFKQRATIDHRLHFDTGILFFRGALITKALLAHGIQPTQEKMDDLKEAFQFLDQILANNKSNYVAGNNLTIADFSIVTSVTSWSFYIPHTDFLNIKAYVENFQRLACYKENKEGLEIFYSLAGSQLKK